MPDIAENLNEVKRSLPDEVILLAVSKTHHAEKVLEAYRAGQRDFGENKAREMEEKANQLPDDIRWHFIGHLQRNKVKYIAPFVHLIQSVDSHRLLEKIDQEAEKANRTIGILLQVHIAEEETKFGFDRQELLDTLDGLEMEPLKHIQIWGLMGMATLTDDTKQVGREFQTLSSLFKAVKERYFSNNEKFAILSMGMSSDYKTAIEQGSNMVRIGSAIFGKRN